MGSCNKPFSFYHSFFGTLCYFVKSMALNGGLSVRFMRFCAILFPILAIPLFPVTDPDIWWHLRTGEFLTGYGPPLPEDSVTRTWLGLRFPVNDPFSYTATEPWRIYAWLPEILYYGIWRLWGLPGVQVLYSLMLALFSWRFWKFLAHLNPRPSLCFAFTLLATYGVGRVAGVRPQLFSYLFLFETVSAILLHARGVGSRILWLPLIFLAWSNCHILFPLGLFFVGIYLSGRMVMERKQVGPETRRLGAILGISVACCLINPYGVNIFSEVFRQMDDWLWMHITELFPPNPRDPATLPLYFLAALSAVWFSVWGRELVLWEWALILGSFYLSFSAVKFIPIPFIVALPIFYSHGKFEKFTRMEEFRLPPWMILAVLVIALPGLIMIHANKKTEFYYPAGAVAYLLDHPQEGNMAGHYNHGGYLIWKLWPQKKVFIDGRAQIFSADFLTNSYGALTLEKCGPGVLEKVLDRFDITHVLWPQDGPLVLVLEKSGWTRIYSDTHSVVLTRN